MYYIHLNQASFPLIGRIDAMRSALAEREEIRFATQDNGTTVACVMISEPETYSCGFAREARGIVFDAAGSLISRPLHKFFNIGERPETQVDALDWSKVMRVMPKRDGSMIHTVALPADGRSYSLKSKKSFDSDVAKAATAFVRRDENAVAYDGFCEEMVSNGLTAIFEYTSPTARIVLAYPEDNLVLLHIRENDTGRYLTPTEVQSWADRWDIPTELGMWNESHSLSVKYADGSGSLLAFKDFARMNSDVGRLMLDWLREVVDVEGWVIQFENGDMVKLKTKWYSDRHRAMTFLRVRDIALLTLDEGIDDLKAILVGDGVDISPIEAIEHQVVVKLTTLRHEVEEEYKAVMLSLASQAEIGMDDRARRALFVRIAQAAGVKHFKFVMERYSGHEVDFVKYLKAHIQDWPLDQINLLNSVAEAE